MDVKGKDGRNYKITYWIDDCFHIMKMYTPDNKDCASLRFNIKGNKAWLYYIEVKDEYQGLGLGQKLFSVFEYFIAKHNVESFEGKYYPLNDKAKPFYLKNGCEIWKDGYDTIVSKNFDKKETIDKYESEFKEIIPQTYDYER